ncbi:MAG: hypothetical protein RLN69_01025, partial [Woeseiaceae bacterium]
YQQDALTKILNTMDPQVRQMMRPQLEQTLGMLDEAQVKMLLASMEADVSGTESSDDYYVEEETQVANEADLEFNRQQYEPAIRKSWQAAKSYDDFVDAELARACPPTNQFAVFGSGWRYEIYPPKLSWPRASNSADTDVQILGASYAPQDGRYRFDFSGVKESFDKAAVGQAIASFCKGFRAAGEAFMSEAKSGIEDDFLPGGYELEQKYNGIVSKYVQQLEIVIQTQAPAANNALYLALLNGERVE